jgi:hypothetical protein
VQADISLDGSTLLVSVAGLDPAAIELPALGGRVEYEELGLEPGVATIGFRVKRVTLQAR